jgi:hypothetical protein
MQELEVEPLRPAEAVISEAFAFLRAHGRREEAKALVALYWHDKVRLLGELRALMAREGYWQSLPRFDR